MTVVLDPNCPPRELIGDRATDRATEIAEGVIAERNAEQVRRGTAHGAPWAVMHPGDRLDLIKAVRKLIERGLIR